MKNYFVAVLVIKANAYDRFIVRSDNVDGVYSKIEEYYGSGVHYEIRKITSIDDRYEDVFLL